MGIVFFRGESELELQFIKKIYMNRKLEWELEKVWDQLLISGFFNFNTILNKKKTFDYLKSFTFCTLQDFLSIQESKMIMY